MYKDTELLDIKQVVAIFNIERKKNMCELVMNLCIQSLSKYMISSLKWYSK